MACSVFINLWLNEKVDPCVFSATVEIVFFGSLIDKSNNRMKK